MNRPTVRPDRPYRLEELETMLFQHFVTDKGQRCRNNGICLYTNNGTGCFIGILLTEEDARSIEGSGPLSRMITSKTNREMLETYIELNNSTLAFLALGQNAHDHARDDIDFSENMANFFKVWSAMKVASPA